MHGAGFRDLEDSRCSDRDIHVMRTDPCVKVAKNPRKLRFHDAIIIGKHQTTYEPCNDNLLMSTSEVNLFIPRASRDDVSRLFHVPQTDEENLFSSIDLPALTKQITSLPVDILLVKTEIPESTLFGIFSEDVQPPLSPVESILSLQEEVTQHTIPDVDDVWQDADEFPGPTKKVDTWETFGVGRRDGRIGVNPFVTEQRPKVFDELLRRHMNHIYSPNESGIVVDEHLFREVPPITPFSPKI